MKQAEEMHYGGRHAKYLTEIAETCRGLAEMTEHTLEEDYLPIVLGGDHSIVIGSFSGVSDFYRKQEKTVGYIWLDAHGDMNTPDSSPSGNIHGMPLAALMGYGVPWPGRLARIPIPKSSRATFLSSVFAILTPGEQAGQGVRGARLHHARDRRARHARRHD